MGSDYGWQYIMDGTGNYYRINANDQLVVAGSKEDASIFSVFEANQRIGAGKKSKFYVPVPVENEMESEEEEPLTETAEVKSEVKKVSAAEYDMEHIDWLDYVNMFYCLSTSATDYREQMNQKQSDVDKELCDLLHYVELYDLSADETFRAMEMIKEARIRRRFIKDKITQIEAFQRFLGTSANVSKAKGCITELKKLERRKYFPRELKEMFTGMEGRKTDTVLWNGAEQAPAAVEEHVPERKEVPMEYCKKETIFDKKPNDWPAVVKQQYDFFANIPQYIVNLEIELDELEQSIEDSLLQIEDANYNVTQGYKAFKELKELRNRRKKVQKEYEQLQMLISCFDCGAMADTYGHLLEHM